MRATPPFNGLTFLTIFAKITTGDIWRVWLHFWLVLTRPINPFSTNVPLLYPLKTSENLRFSDVFRGYRIETLVENGLIKCFPNREYRKQFLHHQICKLYQNIVSKPVFMIAFGIDFNFFIVYLFDWKFVDLMIFFFLWGKMCASKKSSTMCASKKSTNCAPYADRHRARNWSRPAIS